MAFWLELEADKNSYMGLWIYGFTDEPIKGRKKENKDTPEKKGKQETAVVAVRRGSDAQAGERRNDARQKGTVRHQPHNLEWLGLFSKATTINDITLATNHIANDAKELVAKT